MDTVGPMVDDIGDEVPEADALEQRQDIDDDDEVADEGSTDSLEVPEADRLEQSRGVGTDDLD